jgi:hypothetical protein
MVTMSAIQGAFSRNWTLKLSALGVALLLWFSIRFEVQNQQEISNVAVRVDLSDPDWALTGGADPASVAVRFRGPALELLRLSTDRPVVVVPMPDVAGSDTSLVIQPGWVRFGERPGVSVEGIAPGSIRLRFEPVQRITLPAAVRLTGELPEGLALAALPEPTVREFRVAGPRSRTEALDSIPLLPVDLGTITQPGAVPVLVDTAGLAGVQVQPIALELDFRLEAVEVRSFNVAVPELPEPFRGEGYPETVAVRVSGASSVVRALSGVEIRVVPELPDDLEPDWERFEVRFRVEGLPPLLEGQADPVEVRREDP